MIEHLTALDPDRAGSLVAESQREGFKFLARLRDEWVSGTNRFDRPGEALFGLFDGRELVGIGGINRLDELTGRLRHVYIRPSQRRHGWGSLLVGHILSHAVGHFRYVVLRTDTESGDCFYRACGFTAIRDSSDPTHRIQLPGGEPDDALKSRSLLPARLIRDSIS
jgi:GNAT superfamily N-acetyltransferase